MSISFSKAAKLWFGFMWRSFVLSMPVMIVIEVLTWMFLPHVAAGAPLTRAEFHTFVGDGVLIWVPGGILSIILQIQAFRWTVNDVFDKLQ